MTATRVCTKCEQERPLATNFYPIDTERGTYRRVCTSCVRDRVRRHRQANIDSVRAYDRARGDRNPKRGDLRIEARIAVSTAIKAGKLSPEPCEVCGAKKVDAHHDDYTNPLAVRWLCRQHHGAEHRKYA